MDVGNLKYDFDKFFFLHVLVFINSNKMAHLFTIFF